MAGGAAPGAESRNVDHFCVRAEPFDAGDIRAQFARFDVPARPTAARSGDGGPATSARWRSPRRIAFDRRENLYIADRGNHRLRKVGPDAIVTTVACKASRAG